MATKTAWNVGYGRLTEGENPDNKNMIYDGVEVDKRKIECEPIRQVGDVDITVWLYSGVTTPMKVSVVAA